MKKSMPSLIRMLALGLLIAGCSTTVDPSEDAFSTDESRLFDDDAEVQPLAGSFVNTQGPIADDEVRLEAGQRVVLPAFDATLTFVEKTEDSRCPKNVDCVWEGQARIVLAFARDGQAPTTFEMTGFVGPDGTSDDHPPRVVHEAFGLRFTLLALTPYPEDGVEQTDPVTATIRVEAL